MDASNLSDEQTQEVVRLAESLNERMMSSGSRGAELAFGLGCGVGLIPVVGIIFLLFAFGAISLIPAFFLLVVGLLLLAGVSILLANLARSNARKRVYRTEVEPEIAQLLSKQNISRQEFDTLAYQWLPADAPLQPFLSRVLAEETDSPEEPE